MVEGCDQIEFAGACCSLAYLGTILHHGLEAHFGHVKSHSRACDGSKEERRGGGRGEERKSEVQRKKESDGVSVCWGLCGGEGDANGLSCFWNVAAKKYT